MKYTNEDKPKHIRESLRTGDSIHQVCKDYHITFAELIKLMTGYHQPSTRKKKGSSQPTHMYIRKTGGKYILRKNKTYFGRYNTLGDAVRVRDWFICNGWDKRLLDFACGECGVVRCKK